MGILSVTRCYLCYSLRFNCSSRSKSPCSTEHQTHAALQTLVSMCAASSKSAFRSNMKLAKKILSAFDYIAIFMRFKEVSCGKSSINKLLLDP